jgi:peptide/nickel transport system permease protein
VFRYVMQRLAFSVPVIVGISVVVFAAMAALPGDAVQAMMTGDAGTMDAATLANLRRQWGLEDPVYIRYLRFVGGAIHGDLGRSLTSGKPVLTEVLTQFPSTIQLALAGMLVATLFGVSLGVIAAVKHNTWLDTATMVLALGAVSMPQFWFGLILILVFALHFGWFPLTGVGGLEYLVLPAVALGVRSAAILARLTRSSLLEVLNEDYVRTARAKGLAETKVILRHALKNGLIPVVTVAGLQFGNLLAGAFLVEVVFARQGIGQLVVRAILTRDYPLVQGAVLLAAIGYVLVNLLVDLLYAYLNPRIRYA